MGTYSMKSANILQFRILLMLRNREIASIYSEAVQIERGFTAWKDPRHHFYTYTII